MSTRWWLLVDHCVLRNWDRILVRAVKGLNSRAGMVSICPLLWQRDVKLQQTNQLIQFKLLSTIKAQPQNPVHHSTTWCERSLSQGQGSADSPRSDRGHPRSREPLDTSHNKQITSFLCAAESTAPQIFRILSQPKIVDKYPFAEHI